MTKDDRDHTKRKDATVTFKERDGSDPGSGGSADDESVDSADDMACIHFNKNDATPHHDGLAGGSYQHYDEYGSYLTRSERAHTKPDQPPSATERKTRKVQFPAPPDADGKDKGSVMVTIYEIEPYTEKEKKLLFMHQGDFERCDLDLKMTEHRWENHLEGKIQFDFHKYSIRGMEEMISPAGVGQIMYDHQKAVLNEIHDQKCKILEQRRKETNTQSTTVPKIHQHEIDWERVRKLACDTSKERVKIALERGQQDEKDRKDAWDLVDGLKKVGKHAQDQVKKKKNFIGSLFGKMGLDNKNKNKR